MDFHWQKLHDPSIVECKKRKTRVNGTCKGRIIKHPLYGEILNIKTGCELVLPYSKCKLPQQCTQTVKLGWREPE